MLTSIISTGVWNSKIIYTPQKQQQRAFLWNKRNSYFLGI